MLLRLTCQIASPAACIVYKRIPQIVCGVKMQLAIYVHDRKRLDTSGHAVEIFLPTRRADESYRANC